VTIIRYRRADLLLDYGRAAFGMCVAGAVLVWVPTAPVVAVAAGGLAALFAVFGVRTALRDLARYEVTEEAITETGWRTVTLPWPSLQGMNLRYYAPRRKRTQGWMSLSISGGGRRIGVDSTLPGFERIAGLAARWAGRNGVALGEVTLSNLAALGLDRSGAGNSGRAAI
jgi:hypothetical protein